MTPSPKIKSDEVSLSEKLGYGMGDFAANLVLQTQMMFLLNYYTEVFGIGVTSAGILLLAARIVDAFNDLVMGNLADRTQSRWGSYRPWLLFTAIPLGLSFFLVFAGPPLTQNGKLVWAGATLLLMIILYGANNIPYSALGGLLATDPHQRLSVASWRFNLAMFATFIVVTFTLALIRFFGADDLQRGYRITVGIWALMATASALVAFYSTNERSSPQPKSPLSLRKNLLLIGTTKSWLALASASLLLHICLAVRGSVMLFYFQHVIERETWFGIFNGVGIACTMIGIFFSPLLSKNLGKRNAFAAGILLSGLLTSGFFFVSADRWEALFALQILFQISFGATVPLLWGMIADVADLVECNCHRRVTATTFAATLFCFKIGLGIGLAATAWLLRLVEYHPNQDQMSPAILGIKLMVSFIPGFLLACSAVCLFSYDISRQRELSLSKELQKLREGN